MALQLTRPLRCVLSTGAVLMAVVALSAASAGAAVRECKVAVEVPNRALAHAGVTSARNMSCTGARRALRRYGRRTTRGAYGNAGRRFQLGPWSCTIYLHDYELWKARCVRGSLAFRVDYGF